MTKRRKDLNEMFDQWMRDQISLIQILNQLEEYIDKELEEEHKKWGKTIAKLMKRGLKVLDGE